MHSEFKKVALDQVRYSLVWEDSNIILAGLDIQPHDRVMVITSAGCNVLNVLLSDPAEVVAIDLNPVQNKLLELNLHIIRHHEYEIFRSLLGLDGAAAVAPAWAEVAQTLPDTELPYWEDFFRQHPAGILTAGRLEDYITGFYKSLAAPLKEKLQHLLHFNSISCQLKYFMQELDNTSFEADFISYFNDENLSKGRDPKLLKHAQESGGETFYNRLVKQLGTILVKHNFFFRFFFFGPEHLPENILPPCYQKKNYKTLRKLQSKIKIETGEAVDYLLSPAGSEISKASLSNIFEYTSQQEFQRVCDALFAEQERSLRFVFWNLLQEQGNNLNADKWINLRLSNSVSLKDSCFFFRDIRVQIASPVAINNQPITSLNK